MANTPLQFYYHSGLVALSALWVTVIDPETDTILQAARLPAEKANASGSYTIVFTGTETGHVVLLLTEKESGGKRLPDGTLHYRLADTTDIHYPGPADRAASQEEILDAIDAISSGGGNIGSGSVEVCITTNDSSNNPLDGVEVWITTDSAGTNVVAGVIVSDALGQTDFLLDAGSYYVWRQLAGTNFTNPQSITVVEP